MDDGKDDIIKQRQLASNNSIQWFVAEKKTYFCSTGYIESILE